jgi:hypothetical protein
MVDSMLSGLPPPKDTSDRSQKGINRVDRPRLSSASLLPEIMAGMTKHPFLAIRMFIDVLIALFFILAGLGEFTARIHEWPSLVNLGSVALCLLIAAGLVLDFAYTKRRFNK